MINVDGSLHLWRAFYIHVGGIVYSSVCVFCFIAKCDFITYADNGTLTKIEDLLEDL